MNYFAHGRTFLDRPYFLAGTAVPDWLCVCDRQSRVRRKLVLPWCNGQAGELRPESPQCMTDVASGILQHLDDDAWFHCTPAFFVTTARLTRRISQYVADEPGARPGFVGHILTEILLDSVLIERDPELLDRYYVTLAGVDAQRVEDSVNRIATKPARRLALLIRRFCEDQFLRCYLDDDALTVRLNHVMRRVGLPPLPLKIAGAMAEMRGWVGEQAEELMTNVE